MEKELIGLLVDKVENLFPRTGTYFWEGIFEFGFFLVVCFRVG